MLIGSLGYRMTWYPPAQNRGKLRRTGEGLGNPRFFVTTHAKCCPWRYIWGVATKKPAKVGGPGDGVSQYNEQGHHMQR